MTHASSLVSGLRSVALNVPDLVLAEKFYTDTWHLSVAARTSEGLYLRATGADHHVLALHRAEGPARIRHVTLRARSREALDEVVRRAPQQGGRVLTPAGSVDEPGGGIAVTVADADGRAFRLVWDDARHADAREEKDRPVRLAHAVLNCHDVETTRAFLEQVLDFSLSDRTRIMAFMRCGNDHHSIALGDTDNDALNHIAFLMPDLDSVMRGGGRMKDAGYGIQWGPGRHGPGDNAFNYFVGPFDVVIEYTAEVEQIDDSYQAGGPSDWTWPPGRIDQWGIGVSPTTQLKQAQKAIFFETNS
ncbi:glyoxalase [Hylemonella gracilis str. Niagara R]|uniref:Glyoxalase n=1 Tax=Hylemonella gracilis str. Niagara R TaxID=1458275 RepID=A0A016XM80_9BURK|nr:VOC family protein [Hylemonella gracilis]EYC52318.1 glyoxalase [Hylemonella gracilis str. Niagara R]